MQTLNQHAGTVRANGTELYYERRGSGPPVVFISGATGDAGHFERVAAALDGDFTTIVYDRRGNSRSPRPPWWDETSIAEQADDAAGLLLALDLAPAAIVGTSSGAIIGLDLLLRHPEVVRGAVLHEPALISVLAGPRSRAQVQPIIERGMATGGGRGEVEAFVRTVAGDAVFEGLPADLRERMLGNGETLFLLELGAFAAYRPGDAELASVGRPVVVLAGTESPPFLRETSRWLADALDVQVETLPGGHAPYLDRPGQVAATLRPILRRMR